MTHLIQLERDILRCESWLKHCPDKSKIRNEILQYTITLKSNYHAISGRAWEDRKSFVDIGKYTHYRVGDVI
jgi:hypothetical protein